MNKKTKNARTIKPEEKIGIFKLAFKLGITKAMI